jgi:phage virion morphogenesis protein
MSGASIDIPGHDATLQALGAIAARAQNQQPMWDAIGMSLVVSTQHRFETGKSPSGSPWPPSIRVRHEGGRTLVLSGRLMQSVTYVASAHGVEVGTNAIYAAIHQFGGTIVPVSKPALAFRLLGKFVRVQKVTIPARPFLGLDHDDEAEILQIATDYVAGEEKDGGDAH